MGDLQPENGGGGVPPDDGSCRDGLPDLPPEWGTIVVPDDAAALADEASRVRRELRRQAWRSRIRGLAGLRAHAPSGRRDASSLGVPIVIMAVAVITTLLSLFVVTWDPRRSAPVGPETLQQTALPLADVTLTDAAGSRVRLGDVLPAMLLLVDGCDCPELINEIAAVTPKPVLIVPVSAEPACAVRRANMWCLADPSGAVTGRYPAPMAVQPSAVAEPTGAASAAGVAGPTAAAGAASAPASPTPARRPVATGVPVDAYGVAHEPIVVTSADDLTEALATLAAGG